MASKKSGVIDDLVVEDDYDVVRDLSGIPANAKILKAWFTIRRNATDSDALAVLRKMITPDPVPGFGQISGTRVLFQLLSSETNTLTLSHYFYDIQAQTDKGKTTTPEKGDLIPVGQITHSQ